MNNSKKLKKFLIITSIFLITILFFIVAAFSLFMNWSFKVSEYCQQEAQKIVGNNWTMTIPSNDAEKKQFPGLNQINLGFREQLKCEHNPNVLNKFPSWF